MQPQPIPALVPAHLVMDFDCMEVVHGKGADDWHARLGDAPDIFWTPLNAVTG